MRRAGRQLTIDNYPEEPPFLLMGLLYGLAMLAGINKVRRQQLEKDQEMLVVS